MINSIQAHNIASIELRTVTKESGTYEGIGPITWTDIVLKDANGMEVGILTAHHQNPAEQGIVERLDYETIR